MTYAPLLDSQPARRGRPAAGGHKRFRRGFLTGTLLLASVCSAGCGPSADPGPPSWPGIFGPDNNSIAREAIDPAVVNALLSGSPPPEKFRVAVGTGYSSPVVSTGRVIVLHRLDDEEVVSCFDLETGALFWEHRYPTSYKCLYQYSDGPYGTPLVLGGRVYTLGAQWQARCLDLGTGRVVWARQLSDDFEVEEGLFGFGPGMVIDEGRLIFNLGAEGAGVVALDADTGATLWTSGRDRSSFTTPRLATIRGRRHAFVLTFEGLQALDPATGEAHWFVPFSSKIPDSVTATSPVVAGDKVLLVTGPGPGARCLQVMADAEKPDAGWAEVWGDRRVLDSQWNTLIEDDGVVYGYSSKRITTSFRAVDLATGELRWSWTSQLERGTSLLAGDTFVLWGEHGHLAFVRRDPDEHRLLWMSEEPLLASPTYSSPALADGLLLLRNEGAMICLSLRAEDFADAP